MANPLSIDGEYQLSDLETLKVLSDPLRMQILEQIGSINEAGQAATVKQIAAALSVPATKLYYHINLLDEHDLIRVVETHLVSGILEKRYQLRARKIRLDLDLEQGEAGEMDETLKLVLASVSSILEKTLNNLAKSYRFLIQSRDPEQIEQALEESEIEIQQTTLQVSDERAREFSNRMRELIESYKGSPAAEAEGVHAFNLMVVFHPAFHLTHRQGKPRDGDSIF